MTKNLQLFYRTNETPEARNARLETNRLATAAEKNQRSPKTKRLRRAAATAGEARRIENMTPEERQLMLAKKAKTDRVAKGTE